MKAFIILLIFIGVVTASQANAQSCQWVCDDPSESTTDFSQLLRISEAIPNPKGDDTQHEFIELENISAKTVELAGWTLEDVSGRKYTIVEGKMVKKSLVAIDRSVSRISLNNTEGDEVRLYSPDGKLQDEVAYEGSALEQWSYSRFDAKWQWTSKPTPGKKNELVVPNTPPDIALDVPDEVLANSDITLSVAQSKDVEGDSLSATWTIGSSTVEGMTIEQTFASSGSIDGTVVVTDSRGAASQEHFIINVRAFDLAENVRVSEAYPKPATGADEFVEIISGEKRIIELAGWILTDGVTKYAFNEGTTLAPNQYLVVYREESKIALNDSGDTITLFRPDESTADTVSYGSAQRGKSYARIGDKWQWLDPTPGALNPEALTEGIVLGASASALDPQTTEIPVQSNASQGKVSWIERQGPYAVMILFVGSSIGILYWRWKKKSDA